MRRSAATLGGLALAGLLGACGGSAGGGRTASFGDPQGAFPTMTSSLRLGSAQQGHLTVSGAYVTVGGGRATVLFTAASGDGRGDSLVRATSSAGTDVAVAGGPVAVPAHGRVTLSPTGPRLVVGRLAETPPPDATVEVSLYFSTAGRIDVFAPVRTASAS